MSKIVLSEEQMELVRQAKSPVPVCDPNGLVLGTVDPQITPAFIAEMKRRASSPGPWYTGEQVEKHLQALEDAWQREGPFDEKRMFEILEEIRAKDTPWQDTRPSRTMSKATWQDIGSEVPTEPP